jgi:hypothetical protein
MLILVIPGTSIGQRGRTDHIIPHNRTKVLTDPSKGFNNFCRWAVFPSASQQVRKIVLSITYQCPDSMHCGEWDYVDAVYLTRSGGVGAKKQRIELARMISPYGWRFGSTWKFTWHTDVTDFAMLLRDSCEVEFYHSGYESNTDRGWLVTLDFAVTEGKPVMECLGMDTLWTGNFPYGDTLHPISDWLQPRTINSGKRSGVIRMRILQTGHGMDEKENCAEFCSKWRRVYFDSVLADERQVWRKCGDNPLYPQAGTWIFNRANWCPGAVVYPDIVDFPVKPKSRHSLLFEMQPYSCPQKPTAVYNISTCLFRYTSPWAKNDVSLEEIITPGRDDEYSRSNPACSNPRIIIKNNAREPLKSLYIVYAAGDEQLRDYNWRGLLAPLHSVEITLPGLISRLEGKQNFKVELFNPNGHKDEYPYDNSLSSDIILAPAYGPDIILEFRSNHDSTHNSYRVISGDGKVVRDRQPGTMKSNTLYQDTLHLAPGCYQLSVSDTAGDGLDFWFNPEGGYGYVRLLDLKGRLIKSFGSDFGSSVSHWFSVEEGASSPIAFNELPIVNAFPVRNPGKFHLEIFFNEPKNVRVKIFNADSTVTVFEKYYPELKSDFLPVDISAEPDGYYYIQVVADDRITRRKIKVKHQN